MMRFVHAKSEGNGKRPLFVDQQSEMDGEGNSSSLENGRCGVESMAKRRKQFSSQQENELEPVLLHIIEHLDVFRAEQGTLSLPEFKQMVLPLCKLRLQVDTKVVFYHLLLNGVFILADDSSDYVALNPNYKPSDSFRGIIIPDLPKANPTVESEETALCEQAANINLDEDITRPFSPYFCTAYLKAVKWVNETLRDPSVRLRLTELFLHLVRFCQFEIDASASQVIGLLASKNFIRVRDDAVDSFAAPSLRFRMCHYSPTTQPIPLQAM